MDLKIGKRQIGQVLRYSNHELHEQPSGVVETGGYRVEKANQHAAQTGRQHQISQWNDDDIRKQSGRTRPTEPVQCQREGREECDRRNQQAVRQKNQTPVKETRPN